MISKVDPRAEIRDKLYLGYANTETEKIRKFKILKIAVVTHDGDTFCCFINPGEQPLHEGTNTYGLYFANKNLF